MRKPFPFLLASLFVSIVCSGTSLETTGRSNPAASGHDWPQWRGVNRDAVSPETGLLHTWPASGPEVVWRRQVGVGYSSVSVSDGRLYTLWDEHGRQYLVCLDAPTGDEIWRHELGAGFKNAYGDGPRSTPSIDGDVVFAVGTQGRLLAANRRTGDVIWEHDLVKAFSAALPTYGFSASPLVVGDRLLIQAGGKDATFVAVDKRTGEFLWKAENDRPAYSSPIHVKLDGVEQIVFWSAGGLHAVTPDTGRVLWRYAWRTDCPVTGDPLITATPILVPPDRLFISSLAGGALIRVERDEGKFRARTVWESEQMRNDVNSSLLLDGQIFGFDRGILKCLDAATGEVRWKARGFGKGSLIAADGLLLILGESGNLALAEANPKELIRIAEVQILEGKNWTTPTLADGRLYLRNHEEMVCLDVRD